MEFAAAGQEVGRGFLSIFFAFWMWTLVLATKIGVSYPHRSSELSALQNNSQNALYSVTLACFGCFLQPESAGKMR